jgi:hypothetical protein
MTFSPAVLQHGLIRFLFLWQVRFFVLNARAVRDVVSVNKKPHLLPHRRQPDAQRSRACRRLFEPADREENQRLSDQQLATVRGEASQRWNFDSYIRGHNYQNMR